MFEVTEKASEMIKNFLKDREELPAIRLMLAQGGWSGPQLGLALDELRKDDESFDDRGLTFVVEKEFYEKIKPVTIDYVTTTTGEGFQISSNLPEPESACGTSCACWNKQGDIKKPALIDVPAFFISNSLLKEQHFVMNPIDIINEYYQPGSKIHTIVVRHGEDVARKAVATALKVRHLKPDIEFIREAAMLHDVAIYLTNTPKLDCRGKYPYVCHGYLGRELLENRNMPKHALVCERHVGIGITAEDIRKYNLPLPERDMIPLSIEERIICYADKFFSKNGRKTEPEKSVEEVLRDIAHYGRDKVEIFQSWLKLFGS